ncbi:hypothetical protein Rsub_05881 [Raphidocelis subcapitata]|uniref:RNA 3'-terminal phosphate cyclase n=1 Tax=Raphidocelis subcapitata TaxID=307507 RepID=A0A2V0P5L1_9CHLO|nr:hypothetical protein Rsub_05881 [Raphidocelis subcapitata]|eukprot:GBF93150.1 hypothetical protein Rsub_05881 [Raphidocelis subcapitata]
MLRFKGSQQFRQRLAFSTLSGRPIRIDDIRTRDASPGLRDYEASLLRLLEKLTNGCVVEINETGTSLRYRPGVIICGAGLSHECPASRSIGYFLEPLVLLALFAKKPLSITLRGVTNDSLDPSVDVFRTVTLPLLRRAAGIDDALELRIARRGARPGGGGEVALRAPAVKALPAVAMVEEGMVKRVRGIAYSMKVSPQNANRMVDGARGVLNALLADVYVFTDSASGAAGGASPGYGAVLVAETTSGALISAEACATQGEPESLRAPGDDPLVVPEDVGRAAAQLLLDEVSRGGVVDGAHQGLLLTLAALGPEEICSLRLGPLTPHAVRTLRHLREFFGVVFDVKTDAASATVILSCVGCGLKNLSRKIT